MMEGAIMAALFYIPVAVILLTVGGFISDYFIW